jgi:drug/metabolite transporter (DMT)-like permease
MMQRTGEGWGSGLVGVIIFSGSLPATRVAVSGFEPLFLTSARAVIAAFLGALLLWALRQRRPASSDVCSLAIVAVGVVVGFPLLTALALLLAGEPHNPPPALFRHWLCVNRPSIGTPDRRAKRTQ